MAPKKRTGKTLLDQVNRNHVASVKLVRDCCQRERASHIQQCNGFEREGVRKAKLQKKKEIWMRAVRRANQACPKKATDAITPALRKYIDGRDLLLQRGQDILRDIFQVANNMLALAESRARDFNTSYASLARMTAHLQHASHILLQVKSTNGKTAVVPPPQPLPPLPSLPSSSSVLALASPSFVTTATATATATAGVAVVGNRAHPLIVLGKKTAIQAYAGGTPSCWIHADLAHGNDALPSLLEVRATV